MMENILGNIKRMVQEEISNSAKQNTDPGRGTTTKQLEANRLQQPAAGQDAEAPRTQRVQRDTVDVRGREEHTTWTTVVDRKHNSGEQHPEHTRPRPNRVPQRGIAASNRLKAAERNVWIYAGLLSSETTADEITRYLKETE
ncbi:hypothetical protein ANN_12005 [Periplaneta americana]|uniref:Uncharacterized protein n=1 Tax=Periplaneta americana TaxID=6978 RepID=A0ABQ8T6M7_PERAM|nr:hypothetical protein ANN_12005 [Periplaneta americana]